MPLSVLASWDCLTLCQSLAWYWVLCLLSFLASAPIMRCAYCIRSLFFRSDPLMKMSLALASVLDSPSLFPFASLLSTLALSLLMVLFVVIVCFFFYFIFIFIFILFYFILFYFILFYFYFIYFFFSYFFFVLIFYLFRV